MNLSYLQSIEPLLRRVFIKNPAPEFKLAPNECVELLRPLYSLSDARDLWHMTLQKHLTKEIGLVPTEADPSLYFSFRLGELSGLNWFYVDYLLLSGTPEFKENCQVTHRKFETYGDDTLPFTFAGFHLSKKGPYLTIDQTFYLRKLEELDRSSIFSEIQSMKMRVAWLSNTRSDMQFAISQIAQVNEEEYKSDASAHLKSLMQLFGRHTKT